MSEPRVLLYDIENVPLRGYTWGKWKQNVIDITDDWFLLCFAWKWLGERGTHWVGLPQFERYDSAAQVKARATLRTQDDRDVAHALWSLFDEADIVVAHNGINFDQGKARARFIAHGFDPPSPYRVVDTKQVAARGFRFESNSLKDLCRIFGVEAKGNAGGFETWEDCIAGDPTAWRRMERYNRQDVRCLEQVYLKLLPWTTGHPNMALLSDKPDACPICGSTKGFISKGWRYYAVTRRRALRCKACHGFVFGRTLEKSDVTHVS